MPVFEFSLAIHTTMHNKYHIAKRIHVPRHNLNFLCSGVRGDKGDKGYKGDLGQKGDAFPPGIHESLKGPPGDIGDAGTPGISTHKGDLGEAGFPGKDGPMGPKGPKGMVRWGLGGLNGSPGEVGLTGPRGPVGIDGKPGLPGRAVSQIILISEHFRFLILPAKSSSISQTQSSQSSFAGNERHEGDVWGQGQKHHNWPIWCKRICRAERGPGLPRPPGL